MLYVYIRRDSPAAAAVARVQVDPQETLARVQRKLERRVGLPVCEQRLLLCAHSAATGRPRYSLLPAETGDVEAPKADAAGGPDPVAAVRVRDVLECPCGEHSHVGLVLADASDVRLCGAGASTSTSTSISTSVAVEGTCLCGAGAGAALLAPFFGVYVSVVDGKNSKTLWFSPPVHRVMYHKSYYCNVISTPYVHCAVHLLEKSRDGYSVRISQENDVMNFVRKFEINKLI